MYDETDDWDDAPMSEPSSTPLAVKENSKLEQLKRGVQQSYVWKTALAARKKVGEFSAKYPNATRHAITTCEAVIDFYKRRNYFTLVRGGFQIFDTIQASNIYSFYQFARPADGFRYLVSHNKINIGFLFKDTLEKYPKDKITFKNNETCDVFHLEMGDVYYYTNGSNLYIYFNNNVIDAEKLLDFLTVEKFKELSSNFLYLQSKENEYDLTLSAWQPDVKPSERANELKDLILQFNNAGINRSLFFYGFPGTGKTTTAFKLLSDLNYRTIVFSASNKLISFDLIKNLIDILKIDAVIIDDFDQFNQTNKTLDLLEMFNKKLKVLIGIANTLKEFNVAILRPGRFDEIIMINELDEACITETLGKFTDRYLNKVRKWPIAFIQELVKKGQFLSQIELDLYVEELDKRVKFQMGAAGVQAIAKKEAETKAKKMAIEKAKKDKEPKIKLEQNDDFIVVKKAAKKKTK